jgi:RimJ/RimL family protein N-acetyltransferase
MNLCTADPFPRVAARLMLRRLQITDLDHFQAYRCDPDVGLYQGWLPMTTDAATAFIDEMSAATFATFNQWMQLGVADRVTDQLIGDIGICVHGAAENHAEIGYSMAASWQGRGLGAEAVRTALDLLFEHSDIDRVVAITDARNVASVRLLQRVGMACTESVDTFFRGEPCTELTFVIRREVFRAIHPM